MRTTNTSFLLSLCELVHSITILYIAQILQRVIEHNIKQNEPKIIAILTIYHFVYRLPSLQSIKCIASSPEWLLYRTKVLEKQENEMMYYQFL